MNTQQYTGTWRSYKTFFFRGEVKHHELNAYSEVSISDQGDLTLQSLPSFIHKKRIRKDAWQISTVNKRHFLYIDGRKAFEIITLEQDDLVLLELVSGEKIFFASLSVWHERRPSKNGADQNVHVTLWSKSLIKLITLEE